MMIFRFLDGRRDAGETAAEATGTFADGAFPVTLRGDAAQEMALRMRSSYGRDLMAARRLADQAPVFH